MIHKIQARKPEVGKSEARKPEVRKPGARKAEVRKPGARHPGVMRPSAPSVFDLRLGHRPSIATSSLSYSPLSRWFQVMISLQRLKQRNKLKNIIKQM